MCILADFSCERQLQKYFCQWIENYLRGATVFRISIISRSKNKALCLKITTINQSKRKRICRKNLFDNFFKIVSWDSPCNSQSISQRFTHIPLHTLVHVFVVTNRLVARRVLFTFGVKYYSLCKGIYNNVKVEAACTKKAINAHHVISSDPDQTR